jgi:hypothetical protein
MRKNLAELLAACGADGDNWPALPQKGSPAECASSFNRSDYVRYIAGEMDEDADERFERHCRSCPSCLEGLGQAYDLYENDMLYAMVIQRMDQLEAPGILTILLKKAGELVDTISGATGGWEYGSTAFAHRGPGDTGLAFHKTVGRLTIHLELLRKPSSLIDINVLIADPSSREPVIFEVALYKGDRCLETIGVSPGTPASITSVKVDNYELRISDDRGELASMMLKMEQ